MTRADQHAKGWHRQDIRAALAKRYGALTALSVTWGYSRAAISNALRGTSSWPAVEERIARALDTSPHELWPNRWTPEGQRRPRHVIKAEASRAPAVSQRQKREAA